MYRSKDIEFTQSNLDKLIENKISTIFVRNDEKNLFYRYVENYLNDIINDPEIPLSEKSGIIYDTSKHLMEDVIKNPRSGIHIKRSQELVNNYLDYILNNAGAFHSLIKITSYDYYTYTHSVNVCIFSIGLSTKLGLDKKDIYEVGVGGLLHDVGKSKIPQEILNKKGNLDNREFSIVKKHPLYSFEILKENNTLSNRVLIIAHQHHEKLNSRGYPAGIGKDSIHPFSKIVT
ncbi:MAG: HD domain-containing protein, partial [Thermodesulfobacteriota bacterium]|nr:HD domain-containing protein [Thermodesulfobacteriota bacterium]